MPAESNFTLEVAQAGRLRDLIKKLQPEQYGDIIKDLVTDAMLTGESAARRAAKPHTVDTGSVARSIEHKLRGNGPIPAGGAVFTRLVGAEAIDQGRVPGGRMPPVEPIRQWAVRHGIAIPAFVLARAIARRGTRGLFFMRAAEDAVRRGLPGLVGRAADRIESRWSS